MNGGIGSSPTVLNPINGPPGQGRVRVNRQSRILVNFSLLLVMVIAMAVTYYFLSRTDEGPEPTEAPECVRDEAWLKCINSLNGRSDCDEIWPTYC